MITALYVRCQLITAGVRHRFEQLRRHRDDGYTTEQVIVTALLAAAAIIIVGIIVDKVTTRAKSINLGP